MKNLADEINCKYGELLRYSGTRWFRDQDCRNILMPNPSQRWIILSLCFLVNITDELNELNLQFWKWLQELGEISTYECSKTLSFGNHRDNKQYSILKFVRFRLIYNQLAHCLFEIDQYSSTYSTGWQLLMSTAIDLTDFIWG